LRDDAAERSSLLSIESIAVIAYRYPCNLHPTWHVFVQQIAHSFARQGVEVVVINPLAVHRGLLGRDPFRTVEDAGEGAAVTIFRPRFLSMSSRQIGNWNSLRLTQSGIRGAAARVLQRHFTKPPDALYGHFMYPAGAVAVSLGKEMSIPSFPAAGEISLDTVDHLGVNVARCELQQATGFIANSSYLARLMRERLEIGSRRIGVFPNGVNRRRFFPRDRSAMRLKYGLPPDRLLVAFVGNFEPRKGALRVVEAVRDVEGVAAIFMGSGDERPAGDNVLFCGRVPHKQIPELLSASDVFVLPTTDEGCCNAIVEAMACGLPIVSSTGAFNDDILDDSFSMRVDPLDVPAIRGSITRLRDDRATRETMGRAALEWSAGFDIDSRASRILEFMEAEIQRAQCTEVAD